MPVLAREASMSATLFYDNQLDESSDHPGLVEVERVYALDFARFSAADNRALLELYRSLPGAYRETDVAAWFGDSADSPPYLAASAEPSGLQVNGSLAPADWDVWHDAFLRGLTAHPFPLHDF